MGKHKASKSSDPPRKLRPALTPESQENQMISLSMDLAMKQLQEGTASSQVITHFLRLGSTKERLEREKLEEENKLLRAKTEALQKTQHDEEFYKKVLDAMKIYSGNGGSDDDSYIQ